AVAGHRLRPGRAGRTRPLLARLTRATHPPHVRTRSLRRRMRGGTAPVSARGPAARRSPGARNHDHARGDGPPLRLGRGGHRVTRPPGGGPAKDRADRARRPGRALRGTAPAAGARHLLEGEGTPPAASPRVMTAGKTVSARSRIG